MDLRDWNPDGLARIESPLRAIADELARSFTFNPARPSYPGIHAFEMEDVAIYFGRDDVITPKDLRYPTRCFIERHGVVDDKGDALHLTLSRLRKTQKAEWYVKTEGQMERFAVGHTPEVAANHYADIPALRHVHELRSCRIAM